MADIASEVGYGDLFRSTDAVVLGHEFCGEVVGRGCRSGRGFHDGTRVVAFPLMRKGADVHLTGLSPLAPGGYAEKVVVEESLTSPFRTASRSRSQR